MGVKIAEDREHSECNGRNPEERSSVRLVVVLESRGYNVVAATRRAVPP